MCFPNTIRVDQNGDRAGRLSSKIVQSVALHSNVASIGFDQAAFAVRADGVLQQSDTKDCQDASNFDAGLAVTPQAKWYASLIVVPQFRMFTMKCFSALFSAIDSRWRTHHRLHSVGNLPNRGVAAEHESSR